MEIVSHAHFLNPAEVIAAAGIAEGERVADFGCAAGYFSLPCAKAVGAEGEVIALDILTQAIETVQSKARIAGYHMIQTRQANLEKEKGSGLDDESMDWVILKNVLFMSSQREAMLREAFRVVRTGGHLLIVEWNETHRGIGPKSEERIAPEEMNRLIENTGLKVKKTLEAGDYHYSVVAEK